MKKVRENWERQLGGRVPSLWTINSDVKLKAKLEMNNNGQISEILARHWAELLWFDSAHMLHHSETALHSQTLTPRTLSSDKDLNSRVRGNLLRLIHLNYDLCPLCREWENVVTHQSRVVLPRAGAHSWSAKVMRQRWLTLSQLGEVHLQKMQIGWTEPWRAPRQLQWDEWTCVWNKRNRINRCERLMTIWLNSFLKDV